MPVLNAQLLVAIIIGGLCSSLFAADMPSIRPHAALIDRGQDVGQFFGTLFQIASDDGQLVIGAGFQNLYGDRADRHAVESYGLPVVSGSWCRRPCPGPMICAGLTCMPEMARFIQRMGEIASGIRSRSDLAPRAPPSEEPRRQCESVAVFPPLATAL